MAEAHDIILMQVIGNRLSAIAREMGYTLIRSGRSILIRENEDCSAAIMNAQAELVAQDVHCAVHLGSMPLAVKYCVEAIGPENIEPGDVLLHNDPYRGCTHLPDLTMVAPIFCDGEIVFYIANIAHHNDIGGMSAASSCGSARELFQEGLRIPPVKLVTGGKTNQAVIDIITSNVRVPQERIGDIRAQLTALKIGVERITALLEKYGRPVVSEAVDSLLAHSEMLTRAEIAKFPDGQYRFEDFVDDDGLEGDPLKIAATVTIQGSDITFDFTGSSHQAAGSVNSSLAVTYACVYYMTRALTDWRIPVNHGCFRPIKLIAPPGTLLNPLPPRAAVALMSEVYPRILDALLGAFAQCVPDRVVAAPMGTNNIYMIGGVNNSTGRPFVYYECYGGGWGGGVRYDGISGYDCFETNAKATPVEVLEGYYPFKLKETRFIKDSGGAGQYAGGLGVFRRLELLQDCSFTLAADRFKFQPFGLFGGKPGAAGKAVLRRKSGEEIDIYSKAANVEVHAGDEILAMTGGGGGYGDPLARDPELVAQDVRAGKVSVEAAAANYSVVVGPDTLEVDLERTEKLPAS